MRFVWFLAGVSATMLLGVVGLGVWVTSLAVRTGNVLALPLVFLGIVALLYLVNLAVETALELVWLGREERIVDAQRDALIDAL